jgi:hypothetical protein
MCDTTTVETTKVETYDVKSMKHTNAPRKLIERSLVKLRE